MKIVVFLLLLVYLCVLVYVYVTQDTTIFNSSQIEKKDSFSLIDTRDVKLKVADRVVLDGIYKKSLKKDAPLIIYFGGNSDDATRFLLHAKSLYEYDIVAFNYRGYMKSSGVPSEKALFSDALDIYDRFSKNRKVIVIGRSLGTGVAVYLASQREVKGVVLITPYDSISSLAKEKYPFLPIDLLLKHKFESIKYVQKITTPISVIEVKNDSTVPNKHTLRLIKKIKNLALHVELKNATHADILSSPDFEQTIKKSVISLL